jgi:hypothetical protein
LDDAEDQKNTHLSSSQIKKEIGKTLTELADLAIAEYDEGDMSPQGIFMKIYSIP